MITWPLMIFRKNTHISGMVKAMIVKLCMLLETKGPRQQTKFDPQNGRGLWSRDHFCNFRNSHISLEWLMLQSSNFVCYQISLVLSIKRNLTQSGRGLWSRDHFQNFRKTPTFQEWLKVGSWNLVVCSQKLIVRCDTQNLTPKVGVAYGHVTTFTISVKPPYFCNGSR